MILKAGTYRFNRVLSGFENFDYIDEAYSQNFMALFNNEQELTQIGFADLLDNQYIMVYISNGALFVYSTFENSDEGLVVGWQGDQYKELTIAEQEVDDVFGNWYIANTNYNEVNAKPLAEITYNGETIAQLNAGETATLSCEDKKMASDVVVKVNEVESKIPEGYIKPEGTLELVFNNIEAEFPIDCTKYAKVTVNTAEPLKISDPTVLGNITDSPWGVGGSVFLYEGTTTDSYENGAYYLLEDTEK